jgi:hypothetical protein
MRTYLYCLSIFGFPLYKIDLKTYLQLLDRGRHEGSLKAK